MWGSIVMVVILRSSVSYKCAMFVSLNELKRPPSPLNDGVSDVLQDRVSQLERELRDKTQEMHHLQQQQLSNLARRNGETVEDYRGR